MIRKMTNKLSKAIACLIMATTVVMCFSFNALAAKREVRAVDVTLPDVVAEISGRVKKSDIDSVNLNGEKLKLKSVKRASASDSKLVYMLVDISGSMSQAAVDKLKPSLIKYATSLNKKDCLILMTFGTSVKTLLKGGESDAKIRKAINSIRCNAAETKFYVSMDKALQSSLKKRGYDRKLAIVVSDGEDYEKGSSSQEEVIEGYETHRLPIYGMCLSYASEAQVDGFGYIARTSGGALVKFDASNAGRQFNKVKKTINDVSIIEMTSQNKKSSGVQQLLMKIGSTRIEEPVLVNAKKDTTAPMVKSVEYIADTNSLKIKFSEDVENAGKNSSYKITTNGRELTVLSVKYVKGEAIVNIAEDIYTGSYSIELNGITDASDNQNKIESNVIVQEIVGKAVIYSVLPIVGIVLIPIIFLLVLYLILVSIKHKKNVKRIKDIFVEQVEEIEEEKIVIEKPKGMPVKFSIYAGSGRFHEINYNLVNSMIVGRSDLSDIAIEDERMSRQHFAIEIVENGLAVTDLQTTNGTFVNGVQIRSRTFIPNGGKIMAGNSTITVNY